MDRLWVGSGESAQEDCRDRRRLRHPLQARRLRRRELGRRCHRVRAEREGHLPRVRQRRRTRSHRGHQRLRGRLRPAVDRRGQGRALYGHVGSRLRSLGQGADRRAVDWRRRSEGDRARRQRRPVHRGYWASRVCARGNAARGAVRRTAPGSARRPDPGRRAGRARGKFRHAVRGRTLRRIAGALAYVPGTGATTPRQESA